MGYGESAVNQKDAPNGPDIVSFGSLGLNLVLVTNSTPIAEPGSPFYLRSRLKKWVEQPSVLVTVMLLGDDPVHLGDCDFFLFSCLSLYQDHLQLPINTDTLIWLTFAILSSFLVASSLLRKLDVTQKRNTPFSLNNNNYVLLFIYRDRKGVIER